MQKNGEDLVQSKILSKDETAADQLNLLKEENQKLQSDNAELKKKLEKEELYERTLYRQWSELNASMIYKDQELEKLKSSRNPKLKIYKYAFYGLLLFTLILVTFNIFSPAKKGDKNLGDTQIITSDKKEIPVESITNTQSEEGTQTNAAHKTPGKNDLPKKPDLPDTDALLNKPVEVHEAKVLPAKYIVKVKSYFYNKPDNNTQRKTFVLPWKDAYGIVTALDDKNGFIYIVFKNRAGRTSKGWIHKSDLEQVK